MRKALGYLSAVMIILFTAPVQGVPVTEGLIIHLRADALNLNDGDPVAVWPDSASNDIIDGTVLQIPGRGVPTFSIDGYDGFPAVRFSTAQELLDSNVWTWDATKGVTVFGVFTGGTARGIQRVCQVGNGLGNNHQVVGADMVSNQTDGGSGLRYNNGNALTTAANNPLTSGFHVCAWQVNQGWAYNAGRLYVDGTQIAPPWDTSVNPANLINFQNTENKITIGNGRLNGGNLSDDWYDGMIVEILVYNAQLTEEQIQTVQMYLANKYLLSAHDPDPAFGAISQGTLIGGGQVEVELSWNIGLDPQTFSVPNEDITGHYLYLAADEPNFIGIAPIEIDAGSGSPVEPTGSHGPMVLEMDKVYYWRVDESVNGSAPDDPNTILGPIWRFETVKSIPVITQQPTNQAVFLGQTAALGIAVESLSPLTFEWYKSADNATDTPLDDVLVGVEQTLTLENVQASDEGYYYCKVINASGEQNAAYSTVVKLGVKRKVAHWTLDWADYVDGLYLDSSGEGHHAEPNLLPDASQFVAGANPAKTGEALDLTVKPLAAADAGDWEPFEFTGEMTLSTWFKWAGLHGAFHGILTKRTDGVGTSWYWNLNDIPGNMNFGGPGISGVSAPAPTVGEWVYAVVSVSPSATKLYINGLEAASSSGSTLTPSDGTIKIGANNTKNGIVGPVFNGIMDDVRIYNYAMDQFEVADLYYAISETPACLNPEGVDLRFDVTGDCRVGLDDFAMFAGTWLNCGLYPQNDCP
jgi:hypothetical protein